MVYIHTRDVTKFEFEFNSKFDRCFKCFVVECELVESPCSTTDFICTESQRVHTKLFFFLKLNLSHKLQLSNVQHNFCSVTCYTAIIGTLILLTLEK